MTPLVYSFRSRVVRSQRVTYHAAGHWSDEKAFVQTVALLVCNFALCCRMFTHFLTAD